MFTPPKAGPSGASSGSRSASRGTNKVAKNSKEYEVEKHGCLSSLSHEGRRIKDHLTHYLGCIEICERESFFENAALWRHIKKEKQQEEKKNSVAASIITQLKRIQVLRKAIDAEKLKPNDGYPPQNDNSDAPDSAKTDTTGPSLVQNIEESHDKWKESEEYQHGIEKVRQWRAKMGKPLRGKDQGSKTADADRESRTADNGPEQYAKGWKQLSKEIHRLETSTISNGKSTTYDLEKDVNAYVIRFRLDESTKSSGLELCNFDNPSNSNRIKGKYPDQRIALKYLFEDPEILSKNKVSKDQKRKIAEAKSKKRDGKKKKGLEREDSISSDSNSTDVESKDHEFQDTGSNKTGEKGDKGEDHVKEKRPITDIRYIHIPSNNMHWVERLVARYYGENDKIFDAKKDPTKKTEARMLLRPQYWRGQHHGTGANLVYARHMRPICETVSSDPQKAEEVAKNIVLFLEKMPYLHWETDRKREAVARMIDDKVDEFHEDRNDKKQCEMDKRLKERSGLERDHYCQKLILDRSQNVDSNGVPDVYMQNVYRTDNKPLSQFDNAAMGLLGSQKHRRISVDRYGRLQVGSALGQFLLDAARLYEAIANYRDKKMIDDYLFHDAPLHPRRTLDQAHFWKLKSTRARDRDQVVYRSTSIDFENVHRLVDLPKKGSHWASIRGRRDPETNEDNEIPKMRWTCIHYNKPQRPTSDRPCSRSSTRSVSPASNTGGETEEKEDVTTEATRIDESGNSSRSVRTPDGSSVKTDATPKLRRCDHCLENIRKVSRVVMVDQLWMWILDENTIITCFPRRYGVNKRDESGVHKSIRERLSLSRENQFRSVYDIALLILDECSNTFFDRTKTSENLPQVMDIFSEAIGNATYKQTTLFQHLWHWTEEASRIYRTKAYNYDMTNIYQGLLDINPEGKIQREIKDIIEELDIMIQFHRKQCEIAKRFHKHVHHILEPKRIREYTILAAPRVIDEEAQAQEDLIATGIPERVPLTDEDQKRLRKRKWFQEQSIELMADMDDRVQELEGLKNYAQSTAQSVNDLLVLKQQQASVVQAWQAVQQSEETVKQGRAIMVFTIITIIFLPLSFMSSIFGMNNTHGTDGWTLRKQFRLMFSISVAIILPVIMLAYSSLIRSIIWSLWRVGSNYVFVKLHIYYVWLGLRDKWASGNLTRRADEKVLKLRKKEEKQRQIDLKKRRESQRVKEKNERERKEKEEREKKEKEEARRNASANNQAAIDIEAQVVSRA